MVTRFFYADIIAKEVLSNNPKVRKAIVAEFEKESFINDKPNIKFLSDKSFLILESFNNKFNHSFLL